MKALHPVLGFSSFQGEFPRNRQPDTRALFPVVEAGMAQKELGAFRGTAQFTFSRRKDFAVVCDAPECIASVATEECLIRVHGAAFR